MRPSRAGYSVPEPLVIFPLKPAGSGGRLGCGGHRGLCKDQGSSRPMAELRMCDLMRSSEGLWVFYVRVPSADRQLWGLMGTLRRNCVQEDRCKFKHLSEMSEHNTYLYVFIHSYGYTYTVSNSSASPATSQGRGRTRVVRGGQAHSLLEDLGVLFPWASREAAGSRGCSGLR